MGEEVRGVPEAPSVAGTAPKERGEVGIGRYLAGQRRLRDVSLDELAQLTKIPLRSLERLESGAFDAAPDGFVRGFVRTVAQALGLDPDETVMRLRGEADAGDSAGAGSALWQQRALLGRVALLAGFVLAALLVWKLVSLWMAPAANPPLEETILRRDPIRELVRDAQEAPPAPE